MNTLYRTKEETLTIISGFAHPITIIAATSAVSAATVTAFTTLPTPVSASLSAFVSNLKSKNQHRMVREGANNVRYLYV